MDAARDAGRPSMADVTEALGGRIAFGGDYNPEQWPEDIWTEDVALMQQAGVNLVTVGVFSWALLEPEEGRYEFGWLDRVLDLLHDGGIKVDLATATASPPPWFSHAYPHTLLMDAHGVRRSFGARQSYCPSAPEYRQAAAALAGRIAERYAEHPAVVLWHVNNEYGCHNWHCFCDVSAAAFRAWLQQRYADLDALNDAWGTLFWSQRYTDWAQIEPPRAVAYNTFANPGQQLDWWRFCSDELLACYRAEAAAVRGAARQPITTNLLGFKKGLDYRDWPADMDVVSVDHYLRGADPAATQHLSMTADLTRSLAGGAPWLLMEHSTSAVNWQPRNLAKEPGQLRRNSMQHLARGADGTLFFQWRASRAGAEKFHSAMLPHAGADTKVWREVVELGADLQAVAAVAGSRVEPAQVALLFDWPAWWAGQLDSHPSVDVDPLAEMRRWHETLWARHVGTDIVGPRDDFSQYRLVIVPAQYLLDDVAAEALHRFTETGGTILVTYFSGIVDEHDRIRLGGYPGALRDLLGVVVEEFFPLLPDDSVRLSRYGLARVWTELGRVTTAECVAEYRTGAVAGSPAITRNAAGNGVAWYVGTELGDRPRARLLRRVLDEAGVRPVVDDLPRRVEAVRRIAADGRRFLFLINHGGREAVVDVAGTDLITGVRGEQTTVGGGDVVVLREE